MKIDFSNFCFRPIKLVLVLLILLVLVNIFTSPTHANVEENFATSLKTTYTVNENGRTRVTHAFTITNLKPLFTITQYALKLSSPGISEVRVLENDQALPAQVVSTDSMTSIGITFPEAIVGEGKERQFTISYLDPDAAIISGQVLEVAIPKVQEASAYRDYQIELVTPTSFGLPSRVSAGIYQTNQVEGAIRTTFRSQHDQGVNVIFGTEQFFDLSLRYTLDNPTNGARLTQIALPPDTSFQRVVIESLDPLPDSMERDEDGNWIATYRLGAATTTIVMAELKVRVTLEADRDVTITPPTSLHTQPDTYWSTNHAEIASLANQYQDISAIYGYTTNNLSYNYDLLESEITRLGAAAAIANPNQALCQEFTDVFIALARANQIPARRLTGYAHTENSLLRPLSLVEDILHAWPEYYDHSQGLWVPTDPTWGSTSGGINYLDQFDLNHIVFAINGISSQRPYPVGSYKNEFVEGKDVEVRFASDFVMPDHQLEMKVVTPTPSWLPFLNPPSLQITNLSGAANYGLELTIAAPAGLEIWPGQVVSLSQLLPFASHHQSLIALQSELILPTTSTIEIINDDQISQITIPVYPAYWRYLFNPFVLLGVVAGVTVIALGAGSLLVFRRRR